MKGSEPIRRELRLAGIRVKTPEEQFTERIAEQIVLDIDRDILNDIFGTMKCNERRS